MTLVLGYHGCDFETARKLLASVPFEASNKPYDWLGYGSYFWEWDIVRAYEWAKNRRPEAPSIVGAVIELGNCLDLTTRTGIQAVKAAHRSYVELQQRTGNALPLNIPAKGTKPEDRALRYLDRAVMDHLHESNKAVSYGEDFDTVRALFPEGEPLYHQAGFREKTHVQIAVRKQAQIRGVFRVPSNELEELGISGLYSAGNNAGAKDQRRPG